jgi:hypothetical protein
MSEQAPFSEEVLSVNRVLCKRVRKLDLSARVINYLENEASYMSAIWFKRQKTILCACPTLGARRSA